jgi:hypothetical protein
MELFQRNSDQPAASDVLVMFMQIPKDNDPTYALNAINTAHGTSATVLPPNYNWFRYANAVRFYWRGADNSSLANVRITKSVAVLSLNSIENFTAKAINKTDNEIFVKHVPVGVKQLIVQHSYNSSNFMDIANLDIANTVNIYTHRSSKASTSYYRVKLVYNDDKVVYSTIKKVEVTKTPYQVSVSDKKITVQTIATANSRATMTIFDNNGKKISTQVLSNGTTIIDMPSTSAIYFYTIDQANGVVQKGSVAIQ